MRTLSKTCQKLYNYKGWITKFRSYGNIIYILINTWNMLGWRSLISVLLEIHPIVCVWISERKKKHFNWKQHGITLIVLMERSSDWQRKMLHLQILSNNEQSNSRKLRAGCNEILYFLYDNVTTINKCLMISLLLTTEYISEPFFE